MTKLTGKILRTLIREEWTKLKEETSFDDGTKDSRGLVKALQDYVNNNLEGPANVLVDMSDNWDGQPAYVISQAGGSGAAYKLTGEPHTDMRSRVVSSPDQLDTKRIINVTPEKLKAWLSGTNTQPLAPNLPPAPTSNQIKR